MKWQVLNKSKDIVKALLENRGLTGKKEITEFLSPPDPSNLSFEDIGVKKTEVDKVIKRIKQAKVKKEKTIIYGDYDADGICATAILWEALHKFGLDVLPHIPDRFSEGYGINAAGIENVTTKGHGVFQMPNVKLIITVDNGIVAYEGVKKAKELGIDVIVLDHHQKGSKKPATSYILHTTSICGSAIAYFLAKDILTSIKYPASSISQALELAAIGTIADQMPLKGINRSIAKFGLVSLNKTKRLGLKTLFEDSKIESVGTYEVNYIIAPRINAMGRLASGLDSLRLLCTTKNDRARELSKLLTKTNSDRQVIVQEVVTMALSEASESKGKVIVMASESYHEGVIGLAAGKLVEEFYRPAIVISIGKDKSKASARSISGFNIIEAIKNTGLILEGGGHPMAAGFSIETAKIKEFTKKINEASRDLLTDEILEKKIKIDMELNFSDLTLDLCKKLQEFEPIGMGNPGPTFASFGVEVVDVKTVGKEAKHLKLKLKQDEHVFDSIFFGGGEMYSKLKKGSKINVAYQLEENVWNGNISLQLKVRDIQI